MNLEMNGSNIGAIFIMTQLNCQSWLFFFSFFIQVFLSILTIFFLIVYSSFIGISSWEVLEWLSELVHASVTRLKSKVWKGQLWWGGGGSGEQRGRGFGNLRVWALVVLFVLLIAVLHGDALHASFPHRSRGLLQGEPVAHCVVHLAVEGRVEDPLQPEVPVLFLYGRAKDCGWCILRYVMREWVFSVPTFVILMRIFSW